MTATTGASGDAARVRYRRDLVHQKPHKVKKKYFAGWNPKTLFKGKPSAGRTAAPSVASTLFDWISSPKVAAVLLGVAVGASPVLGAPTSKLQGPPSYQSELGQVVFGDFDKVDVRLSFDPEKGTATGRATVDFSTDEKGSPVINLERPVVEVSLDGERQALASVDAPDGAETFQAIEGAIEPGKHRAEIGFEPKFWVSEGCVSFSTRINDIAGKLAEQSWPANVERDQYATTVHLDIAGAKACDYDVVANGEVKKLGDGQFLVEYPSDRNAAGALLKVVQAKDWNRSQGQTYTSIDGREIELDVRVPRLEGVEPKEGVIGATPEQAAAAAKKDLAEVLDVIGTTLAELEADLGPLPHDRLTVMSYHSSAYLGMSAGGVMMMEYPGAIEAMAPSFLKAGLVEQFVGAGAVFGGEAGRWDNAVQRWFTHGKPTADLPNLTEWVENDGRVPPRCAYRCSPEELDAMAQPPRDPEVASQYAQRFDVSQAGDALDLVKVLDTLLEGRGGMTPILKALVDEHAQEGAKPITSTDTFRDFVKAHAPAALGEKIDAYFSVYAPTDANPVDRETILRLGL